MLKQPLLPAELHAPCSRLNMDLQHQPEQAQAASPPAAEAPKPRAPKLKIKMGGKMFNGGALQMHDNKEHAPLCCPEI